ncbi:MAG TPA: hypothetical protein VH083_03110 [Myxococcales bacterium]|jgi:hypothetical protein|nr:hypothetical protein [Myxococcales bacterium]
MIFAILAATTLSVSPTAGNSKFDAIFDAPLGEKIDAMSSAISCNISYDAATGASGSCTVPLTSITVDNEPTKTEHFQQWATNKKVAPKKCNLQATLSDVKAEPVLLSGKESQISGDATFIICGKARTDGGKEKVTGTAMKLDNGTVRLRVKIEHFNRDQYKIGPKYTEGWLQRVQQLAPVVAEEGTIDLSLFAKPDETKTSAKP